MSSDLTHKSKFLALILRHAPEKIGLKLDKNGWADVQELITKIANAKVVLTLSDLYEIVATDNKKRYVFNEDETKIRASQGHSINIDLELKPITPPDTLYHGTAKRFWISIDKSGLSKMNRQYVHLSQDKETAHKVGIRHGDPIILTIDSKRMYESGYAFYLSENKVWLTEKVPREFIV